MQLFLGMTSLSHQLQTMSTGSITNLDLNSNTDTNEVSHFRQRRTVTNPRYYFFKILQIIHFGIVMFYLWAGLVEFINNPPFFDAYGDALTGMNKLPEGIFAVRFFSLFCPICFIFWKIYFDYSINFFLSIE